MMSLPKLSRQRRIPAATPATRDKVRRTPSFIIVPCSPPVFFGLRSVRNLSAVAVEGELLVPDDDNCVDSKAQSYMRFCWSDGATLLISSPHETRHFDLTVSHRVPSYVGQGLDGRRRVSIASATPAAARVVVGDLSRRRLAPSSTWPPTDAGAFPW